MEGTLHDWDAAVPRIQDLIYQLEKINADFGALVWEYEWDRRDMLEDIQSLRALLRDGISGSSIESSQVKRAMEAGPRGIIADLEAALRAERSKNWELSYHARDVEEDKWKLQVRLQNSVPVGDAQNPLSKAKTALELALELEVAELQEMIRNSSGGRGGSKSV
ncbi:hypothetical protein QBC34DRAFT_448182 [Podospora aff. communis PSN243]|uniref:Uncharacterized protein n=1 Tax=Podospora aff. communis PSN243 TaxID=3040156 RepID=A0AAV9GRF6_9PEZI|nr:hypothetical protein QBC34DRAFT_448182 [Podospora aff. communis PSN243]